jgi:hypothetical protein
MRINPANPGRVFYCWKQSKHAEVAAQKIRATRRRAELNAHLAAIKKISPTTHRGQRVAGDLDRLSCRDGGV